MKLHSLQEQTQLRWLIKYSLKVLGYPKAIAILFFLWLALLGLASCALQPVQRGEVAPPPSAPALPSDLADLKKRVWVIPFTGPESAPEGVDAKALSLKIHKRLLEKLPADEKSPFLVQSAEDEETFKAVGINEMTDPKEVAKALKGSDIAGFLMGKITQIDVAGKGKDTEGLLRKKVYQVSMNVQYELYDTMTGRQVASSDFKPIYQESRSEVVGVTEGVGMPDPESRLSGLLPSLVEKIYRWALPFSVKLSWSGRVLRIDGGRIYLSAGRKTGLMVGDVLKVLESPRDIIDPQTGLFVGLAPGRLKGTVKVIQYFGNDGAIAVLQSGGNLLPDDRVELY